MPSAQEFSVRLHKNKPFPNDMIKALEANHIDANVILPLLKKSSDGENSRALDQFWLCCVSTDSSVVMVDMVLSCTENEMGKYPVFIVPTQPMSRWTTKSLRARLRALAEALHNTVPRERVYSVFAPDAIASLFSQQWSELVGISINQEPYYAARLLSCTAVDSSTRVTPPGTCRLAVAADAKAVASLCKGFSEESWPFVLEWDSALKEASLLISKKQVWIHSISDIITCIVAFTRNTPDMATITKVYTDPAFRRRGCAKYLVREVTRHLLTTGRYEVVLYVAHNNGSAASVYESVGFVEPDATVKAGHSVNWTEVGFDRDRVTLGHW